MRVISHWGFRLGSMAPTFSLRGDIDHAKEIEGSIGGWIDKGQRDGHGDLELAVVASPF